MNTLAITMEIGTHPATALILGGLAAAVLRGRFASMALVLAPILGFWHIYTLELGSASNLALFGYDIIGVAVDQQAKLFGYLFHLAALVAGIYSFHLRDPWQISMALLYAATAVGVAFAGDMLSLFLWWEGLAITSVFQIWGRKTKQAEESGFRYLFFHVSSGLLLLAGILLRYHGEGASAFSLEPLTQALEAGDFGAWLILLAIGIKAAFPGLHVWLKDGYAEATPTGPVWLCAFTTKCAVCMLARLFPGAEILIAIGGVMAMFPIFYAVIENDLRRVLCYSKINQIGFMVVGIGIGTPLAIDGAIAHAYTHVLYKGLLFMSMGAVLYRTGEIRGSHLGGLYKSMPWTTGFCIVGAASISAFPLFSGFVSKSIIITETARNGHVFIWMCLLFASAGVFHHAGIKIPFFAFFAHDSGLRPKEAPINMLIAMGISSFMCIFLGCNPQWLYDMLPNGAAGYHPYDATHVITQLEILLFSALAFTLLNLWGKYPPELPSVNLDIDWVYRKAGRKFLFGMDVFWNGLNKWVHRIFMGGIVSRVNGFAKAGQVYVMTLVAEWLHYLGANSTTTAGQAKSKMDKRAKLGLHPIGLTAVFALLFVGAFLFLASF
ncbi:Na(+)/H(+) antiporter subunit D [Opitutales bacterium]|mgnify:FL=1|nr:Na(+)/H(+) antiporter subunit D [Opitutales bacterium]MDC1309623.1 Na(+)/H(+) antiporter subunit D [Opitutales bacterium]